MFTYHIGYALNMAISDKGSFKKYVRSEGGEGVPKKAYEIVQGGGRLFKERTYSHVIFKWCLLAKHSKQIKLSFKDCKRKIAFSVTFMQTFDSV